MLLVMLRCETLALWLLRPVWCRGSVSALLGISPVRAAPAFALRGSPQHSRKLAGPRSGGVLSQKKALEVVP